MHHLQLGVELCETCSLPNRCSLCPECAERLHQAASALLQGVTSASSVFAYPGKSAFRRSTYGQDGWEVHVFCTRTGVYACHVELPLDDDTLDFPDIEALFDHPPERMIPMAVETANMPASLALVALENWPERVRQPAVERILDWLCGPLNPKPESTS